MLRLNERNIAQAPRAKQDMLMQLRILAVCFVVVVVFPRREKIRIENGMGSSFRLIRYSRRAAEEEEVGVGGMEWRGSGRPGKTLRLI